MIHKQGSKLIIRDMESQDIDAWGKWLAPGNEWQKLDAPYYQYDLPPDEIERRKEIARDYVSGKRTLEPLRRRGVIALAATNIFIGEVTRYWISEETNWTALGIAIYDPAMWGKGYGTESLGLWSAYMFENEPTFARLDLRTWSGNVGMMRVAEKVGYQQEACFRKARIVDGKYYDSIGYGILREEWNERYPDGFIANT